MSMRPGRVKATVRRCRQPRVRLRDRAVWDYMTRNNVSQNELARLAGLSPSYLSQLIAGLKSPQAGSRRKLLRAMAGTTFDDLFIVERSDGA